MAERVQTYKNHLRWLPAFHFFVLPVLLLNVLNEVRRAWRYPSEGSLFVVVVAAALFTLAFLSRSQAVTVQDRRGCHCRLLPVRDAVRPWAVRKPQLAMTIDYYFFRK